MAKRSRTWTDTNGQGWRVDTGTSVNDQFYLIEWRNFDGFDEGLKYAYDTAYSRDSWKVDKIRYNAPGMLVWYRDTTYGSGMSADNHVVDNGLDLPSGGAKGGLLLVDSHFDPLRRHGEAADADPTTLKNLPSRPQSSNAAFGLRPTYPFSECTEMTVYDEATDSYVVTEPYSEYCADYGSQAPVRTFTDAKGWAPGLENRGEDGWWWRDADASAVVPSRGNEPYSTRVVNSDGGPATQFYGADFGFTLGGSGDPSDDGVAYGTKLTVQKAMKGNRAALIAVTPPRTQ